MEEPIYVKHLGGGWYVGVPARDLTRAEFDALSHDQQMLILASVHYQLVEKPQRKQKVEVTPQGGDKES